jgi:ferritin-like metal-binding protein YciE
MKLKSLNDLFVEELKDLYSAEQQLLKALPKMAKAASTKELREGLEAHEKETQEHVKRLEQIFEDLHAKPTGVKCEAMEGLIEEGEDFMKADGSDAVRDAALISAAQRVEHYEIAAYGTVRTFAEHLGNDTAKKLLQQTLDEEAKTDEKLTHLAESGAHINEMAAQ